MPNKQTPSRNIFRTLSRWRFVSNARGLSTFEYAVLFVVILVGGLTVWKALGSVMLTKVRGGHERFSAVLNGERVSVGPLNNTNRSNIGTANDQYSVQSSRSEPVQVVSTSYPTTSTKELSSVQNRRTLRDNTSGNQTTANPNWKNDVQNILFGEDQDKAFLQDLHNDGWKVTAYDRIVCNDSYYDKASSSWKTRETDIGGTIKPKSKEIIIVRTGDPAEDASTIYHEAVHVAQPSNMKLREREYDAYGKEEKFRIDHYIPASDPTFRKNNDLLSDLYEMTIEDVNETGIKAAVDKDHTTYPGITVASPTGGQPERIYNHLPDGRTAIERSDGSTYYREPREGDAHQSLDPPVTVPRNGITINLGR